MSSAPRCFLSLCLLWTAVAAACAAQHGPRKSQAGDTHDPVVTEPEGNTLRQLVHDVFTELERDAELRCPCYVEAGDYPSEEECVAEVGRGARSIDCIEEVLGDTDDPGLRRALECALDVRHASNACLQEASCDEQLTRCYDTASECPALDPALLTQAARACPGAIGVFR